MAVWKKKKHNTNNKDMMNDSQTREDDNNTQRIVARNNNEKWKCPACLISQKIPFNHMCGNCGYYSDRTQTSADIEENSNPIDDIDTADHRRNHDNDDSESEVDSDNAITERDQILFAAKSNKNKLKNQEKSWFTANYKFHPGQLEHYHSSYKQNVRVRVNENRFVHPGPQDRIRTETYPYHDLSEWHHLKRFNPNYNCFTCCGVDDRGIQNPGCHRRCYKCGAQFDDVVPGGPCMRMELYYRCCGRHWEDKQGCQPANPQYAMKKEYACCHRDGGSQGCKQRYSCCQKSVSSKGCTGIADLKNDTNNISINKERNSQ